MTKNMTGMKKIISVMLLGSLLVTGAVAYADTLSDKDAGTDGSQRHMEQRGDRENGMLAQLVTAGIITAEEQATIQKALTTQREAMRTAGTEAKTPPAAGTERISHFAQLAEDGLITEALAEKIDAYMTEQRDAAFATEAKPLVDAGTFADTAAVQTAMDAVRDAMRAEMDALKPSTEREKVDFKSMTEAERTAFKEKMDAERTAMKAEYDAAIEKVYDGLVQDGTLTQAQADALQKLMENHVPGDGGHGPGFGGMGRHGGPVENASEATE